MAGSRAGNKSHPPAPGAARPEEDRQGLGAASLAEGITRLGLQIGNDAADLVDTLSGGPEEGPAGGSAGGPPGVAKKNP